MSWWTSQRLHPKIKSKFLVVFGDCFYIPSVKSVNKPKVEFDTKEYRLINHMFNYPGNAKWQPVTIKFIDMNGDVEPSRIHEFFDTSSFLWQIMNNTGYRYPYHNVSHYLENHYRRENQTTGESAGHWIATKIDDEAKGAGWRTITTPEKSSTIANSFGPGLTGKPDFKPASTAKQKISIYQIDPDGLTVELWHLVNPIVKSVGWGDLAYDSDEPVEYELQIVYDWAILDRKALGKEPEICVEKFSEFMKTIYITNEIDLDGDLENRINALKEKLTEGVKGAQAAAAKVSLSPPSPPSQQSEGGLEDHSQQLEEEKIAKIQARVAQAGRQEVEDYVQQLEEKSIAKIQARLAQAQQEFEDYASWLPEARQEARQEAKRIYQEAIQQTTDSEYREQYQDSDYYSEKMEIIRSYFGNKDVITPEDAEAVATGTYSFDEIIDQIESRQDQDNDETE